MSYSAARIELVPTLSCCIETIAKQEFSKIRDLYLQKGVADKDSEEGIELLRMFLETTDFRKLRKESEKHLLDGEMVKFVLCLEEGKVKYKMKVEQ